MKNEIRKGLQQLVGNIEQMKGQPDLYNQQTNSNIQMSQKWSELLDKIQYKNTKQ
jgi:hypothetical protein